MFWERDHSVADPSSNIRHAAGKSEMSTLSAPRAGQISLTHGRFARLDGRNSVMSADTGPRQGFVLQLNPPHVSIVSKSPIGTFRTCRDLRVECAFGVNRTSLLRPPTSEFDPRRTCGSNPKPSSGPIYFYTATPPTRQTSRHYAWREAFGLRTLF